MKDKRSKKVCVLLTCLTSVLTGCSHLTSEVGKALPASRSKIQRGSSVNDVLRVAGPPSKISAAADGFSMLYEYNGVEEKQLGINFNVPVLNWFKFVGAKSWLEHQAWVVTFDETGIVRGSGEEHWRKPLGTGGGVQILVTVASLVDSSQVRRPSPQHDWGRSSLVPLPKSLNFAQSLDQGAFGFEQSIAPNVVGQRTLEMTPPPKKFPKKK